MRIFEATKAHLYDRGPHHLPGTLCTVKYDNPVQGNVLVLPDASFYGYDDSVVTTIIQLSLSSSEGPRLSSVLRFDLVY